MAISFSCDCGKTLLAQDKYAGKRTKCPECGAVLRIPDPADAPEPAPAIAPELDDPSPYGLEEPVSRPVPEPSPRMTFGDEEAAGPSTYRPMPSSLKGEDQWSRADSTSSSSPEAGESKSTIREYAYLLLIFALVPLGFSLLGKEEKMTVEDRLSQTLDRMNPEEQARALPILAKDAIEKSELFAVLPGGKLVGAHLPHDTTMHWVYAGIATVGFLLMILAFFSVERANPLHLLGIGLFTGTIGIVFLFAVQFCSQIRGQIRGRGWIVLIFLILQFIGWSYRSALDPDSNFLLSTVGYTFGVGLCEELCKALPLFVYFKRQARMGWRGACLWGLASGIGFGVSEGIMYAGDSYNGLSGVDIYVVRFVSCVALHAMWAASVGISIARRIDAYEAVDHAGSFGLFMLQVLAVPMVLHGLYDTLLKKDMNVWALVVALASFGWLTLQIELARGAQPEAGTRPAKRRVSF